MADISRLSRFVAGLPHDVEMDTNTLVLKSLKLTDNISDNVPTELTENVLSFLNSVYGSGLTLDHLQDAGTRTQIMTVDNAAAGQKQITSDNVDVTYLSVTPAGGPMQEEGTDFTVTANGSYARVLNWEGLGLAETLANGDNLILQYTITETIVLGGGLPAEGGEILLDGGVP